MYESAKLSVLCGVASVHAPRGFDQSGWAGGAASRGEGCVRRNLGDVVGPLEALRGLCTKSSCLGTACATFLL